MGAQQRFARRLRRRAVRAARREFSRPPRASDLGAHDLGNLGSDRRDERLRPSADSTYDGIRGDDAIEIEFAGVADAHMGARPRGADRGWRIGELE